MRPSGAKVKAAGKFRPVATGWAPTAAGLDCEGEPAIPATRMLVTAVNNTTDRLMAPPLPLGWTRHCPRRARIVQPRCEGLRYRGSMTGQPMEYPLEPSTEEMRRLGERALDFVVRFIENLPASPAVDLDDVEPVIATLRRPPTEDGRPFPEVLEEVGMGAAKAFNTTGPGYLAFIQGGGLYAAAVADFLACGLNRFVNVWNAAPGFAQIEWTVIRWLCGLFELPEGSGGILTSGGSMANFS